MSLMTTWGYAIEDAEELTDLLTVEEFNAITANKYAGDARIQEAIKAASMAIRNYCGWHIFPQLACICSERILSGDGRLKWAFHLLPSMGMLSLISPSAQTACFACSMCTD